jgi:ATP/maltotriose-dependent transcriptional regulator MalT
MEPPGAAKTAWAFRRLAGMLADVEPRVSSPVLVGRSGQLSALDTALTEAGRGHPSTVMVGGEAGVGKSRLVTEFAGRAQGTGVRVLTGGCLELGADSLPFAPFTSVLRELVHDLGAAGVAGLLPGGGTRELARLLPEFGEPAGPGDAGEARARLFEQVLLVLEHLADAGPVVLVIEDMHWADRSTRDLLAFLIRNQLSLDGVLIVVTYRSDDLHRTHPLRPLLAELDRIGWVTRMDLGRLSRQDTGQLAAQIIGREPGHDLLAAVYGRTEGNPLFVEALLGDGELGSGLPESLHDLLMTGVRRLPEETQEVVRVASAGGDRTGHGLLTAVTGLDGAALARALRPAVAANVLLTDSDGYLFRHALIREAVHDELLPGERSQVHSRFAEVIAADPALVAPGQAPGEQARHWYAAHDTPRALVGAWQAAGQAGRALAYAEQLAMLSRVLELWEQVPDAARRVGADHGAVLEEAVQAAELAGEDDRGVMLAQAALREIDAAAEPVRAALLLQTCGHLKYHLGRADYLEDLRAAVALVPAEPPSPARARVLESLAHYTLHVAGGWDDPELRAAAEEAVATARQTGDAAAEAAALNTLACAEPIGGNVERVRALLAQARALAAQAGAYQPLLGAAITESDMLEGAGLHELAATVAREGLATAREHGLARTYGAVLACNVAEPLVSLGQWDEAGEIIERALQLFPPRLNRTYLRRLAGDIALARGDLAAAARSVALIRSVLDDTRHQDQYHLPLIRLEAELRLAQGAPAEAVSLAAGALDRPCGPRFTWPLLVAGARACAAAASDGAQAAAVLGRLNTEAGKLAAEGLAQQAHRATFTAEAERANRALAGGEPGGTRASWDQAAQAWEAVGQPYPLAMALLRSAEAVLSAGDRDGGTTRLRRAAELAQRLGARPLSDDIAWLARRARISIGDEAQEPEPERLGLTAREFEVLRLVAAGRSNREIAGELFISAKTASVHVSNILAKLGVTSRGEAAAAAHRLRLFDAFPAGSLAGGRPRPGAGRNLRTFRPRYREISRSAFLPRRVNRRRAHDAGLSALVSTTANAAGGIVTVSCVIATPGLDAASIPVPGCPSGSRTVPRPRFAAIRSRPRRTRSQRPSSSKSACTRSSRGSVSSGRARRSAISSRYQARMPRCGSRSRSVQSSLERRKVCLSWGSGMSAGPQPWPWNSALRPWATASASQGSVWSVKYCHGVSAPHSSPMKSMGV